MVIEPLKRESQSGVLRLLSWRQEARAKQELIKQSEAPESIRVWIFCGFLVFKLIKRADRDEKEVALIVTSS